MSIQNLYVLVLRGPNNATESMRVSYFFPENSLWMSEKYFTFYKVNVQAFRNFRHVRFGYARPRNALFNVTLISEVYMFVRSQNASRVFFFISDKGHFSAVINRRARARAIKHHIINSRRV
ncbi:hypothetical protein CAJAP_07552 [Camponotus japonicus]